MNVLKAIKNVRSRNLITIHVERILDVKPTKIELTADMIKTNYKVLNNPMDVILKVNNAEIFLKDIQQIKTSIQFTEAFSDNQFVRIPTTRLCEIYLINPLDVEEDSNIMLLLEK